MKLIDTHCHIQDIGHNLKDNNTTNIWAKLDQTIDQVIKEAIKEDVQKLIVVGCNLDESIWAVELARKYPNVFCSIGIHPHEADNYSIDKEWIEVFKSLIQDPKVVAVGECGLDFHYNYSRQTNQLKILEKQMKLALSVDKPLIFHVRDGFDQFFKIFDKYNSKPQIRGVLHSYTDNLLNLELALSQNLYIGVNGIATFCKDDNLLKLYKKIPSQNLILETDSPYLTPIPFRGTINTPKNVKQIARFLAELRGEELGYLAEYTTNNSQKLFSI